MDDQNDSNDANVEQMRNAELVYAVPNEQNPETFVVDFGDRVEHVPATYLTKMMFQEDLYEDVEGENTFEVDGETIKTRVDVSRDYYTISVGWQSVGVPEEWLEVFVDAFASPNTGEQLRDLYYELIDGQARATVVENFIENGTFDEDRIDATNNGWIIDDTFLVNYDAENYFAEDRTVYIPRNRGDPTGVVEADESKEAVSLSFPSIDGVKQIDGVTLTETEQEFVATVEVLLHPEDHLDATLVEKVRELRNYTPDGDIGGLVDGVEVSAFTDARSGVHHDHEIDKHRLTEEFSVTQEAIDKMYSAEYDHLALHELLVREPEFRNAGFDVFHDVPNDDEGRWEEIDSIADRAPVSARDIQKLQEMFEDDPIEITRGR